MKTYKIEKLPLTNDRGEVIRVVSAKCLGLLAVTPTDYNPKGRARHITHIPTGFRVCGEFATQAAALEALPKWVDAADWNFFKLHDVEVQAAWEAVKAAGLR